MSKHQKAHQCVFTSVCFSTLTSHTRAGSNRIYRSEARKCSETPRGGRSPPAVGARSDRQADRIRTTWRARRWEVPGVLLGPLRIVILHQEHRGERTEGDEGRRWSLRPSPTQTSDPPSNRRKACTLASQKHVGAGESNPPPISPLKPEKTQ